MQVVIQAGSTELQGVQHLCRGRSQELLVFIEELLIREEKDTEIYSRFEPGSSACQSDTLTTQPLEQNKDKLYPETQFDSQAGSLCYILLYTGSCDSHVIQAHLHMCIHIPSVWLSAVHWGLVGTVAAPAGPGAG